MFDGPVELDESFFGGRHSGYIAAGRAFTDDRVAPDTDVYTDDHGGYDLGCVFTIASHGAWTGYLPS